MNRKFSLSVLLLLSLVGCNEFFSVNLKGSISAPTLSLSFPAATSSVFPRPVFTIQGLENGDTVQLFSNSTCSVLVSSGSSTGSSLNLTSSNLSSGTYNFHAKRANSSGASPCSSVGINYIHAACPTGYLPVAPDSNIGTTEEFCVMKFEASNNGGMPESVAAPGGSWVFMTASQAKGYCGLLGGSYDLISNPEWMTIARHLEAYASNWTGNAIGSGRMFQGHSDNSPAGSLGISNVNDPYNGTLNLVTDGVGTGTEQKRTLEFSWGDTIWDFSGNNAEWIDWTSGGVIDYAPSACHTYGNWASVEFPVFACGGLVSTDYMPGNPASIAPASYNSAYGVGAFQYGGAAGTAISRGGAVNFAKSGVFFYGHNLTTDSWGGTGFRCVYRP